MRPSWGACRTTSGSPSGDVARHPEAEEAPGLLLVRPDAPLYFFNVDVARAVLLGHVDGRSPRPSVVVVDVGATGDLDVSTVEMLSQLLDDLHDRDCRLVLAQVKGVTRDRMQVTRLMQAHRRGTGLCLCGRSLLG